MELFGNLLLSQYLGRHTGYMSFLVDWLSVDAYEAHITRFLQSAILIHSIDEAMFHRKQNLVMVIPALHDDDGKWHQFLIHDDLLGLVVGVGGHGGFGKPRGVHRGSIFVRRVTNLILVVAKYSPYNTIIHQLKIMSPYHGVTEGGCALDKRNDRDLPYLSTFLDVPVRPRDCVVRCLVAGYSIAGLQAQEECWCGDKFGKHGFGSCDEKLCKDSGESFECGAAYKNSIYTAEDEIRDLIMHPDDTYFVAALAGESCTDACKRTVTDDEGGGCDPQLMTMIRRNCRVLKEMFPCDTCAMLDALPHGWDAPGFDSSTGKCYFGKTKHLQCDRKPEGNSFRRACACAKKIFD